VFPDLLVSAVLFYVIFGVPAALILRRAGISGWWSLLIAVPLVNVIALWSFAFVPWPALSADNDNRDQPGPRHSEPDASDTRNR
jgi:uncharacterized membrane protein YhaH (DUF805 family)